MRIRPFALILTLLLCIPSRAALSDPPAASPAPAPKAPYFGPYVTQVTATSAKILWVMVPGTPVTSNVEIAGGAIDIQTKPIPMGIKIKRSVWGWDNQYLLKVIAG